MKKFFDVTLFAVILTCLFALSSAHTFAAERPYDGSLYGLSGNTWVVEDVNGTISDAGNDKVELVVLRDEADNRAERMWLRVEPGYPSFTPIDRRPQPYLVPLPEGVQGYNPHIEFVNFIPGDQEEIFLTFDASPTGPKYFAVVQIRHDDPRRDARLLFDSRTMDRAILSGEFIGQRKAQLRVTDTNTNVFLDLTGRKDFYEREGVYDASGKLLKYVAISVSTYNDIMPGERDANGISDLHATIELYGLNDDDHLGRVNCILHYDPDFGSWRLTSSEVVPAPDLAFWTR